MYVCRLTLRVSGTLTLQPVPSANYPNSIQILGNAALSTRLGCIQIACPSCSGGNAANVLIKIWAPDRSLFPGDLLLLEGTQSFEWPG